MSEVHPDVMALTVAVKRGIHARIQATLADSDDEADEWFADYAKETRTVAELQRSISERLVAPDAPDAPDREGE